MKQRKTLDRLAPSIQIAHARVSRAWYFSILHGLLLLALGLHLLIRGEPGWVPGGLALMGMVVVPLLGRAAYHGNSFSAFLLLLTVVVPPVVAFLAGFGLGAPLVGLAFAPVYYLGVKGATGLRGRRASRRTRAKKGS